VQGGIVAAMLDMAMAMAAKSGISTASMHFEILRPVTGPQLRVDGTVSKRGRRIVFAEAEMREADGTLVARGRQTAVPLD
jgi:acyl-coenzyme A thioesterase PaaI-like protein